MLVEGLRVTAMQGNSHTNTIYMLVAKRYNNNHLLTELQWCSVFGNYFAGEGITINGLTISMDRVPQEKLPSASTAQQGAVQLAASVDVNEGIDVFKAITPHALKQANLLEHLFEFVEDTGQSETELVVPEGKILALYKESTVI